MKRQRLTDSRRWFAPDRAQRFRGTGGEDLFLTASGRWVLYRRPGEQGQKPLWVEVPDTAALVWLDFCGYVQAAARIRARLTRQAVGLARAFEARPWLRRSLRKEG